MEDFRIYTVDVDDIKDLDNITFDDVKENSIDWFGDTTVEGVLIQFLQGINRDAVSDIYFHFLVDETEGRILQFK